MSPFGNYHQSNQGLTRFLFYLIIINAFVKPNYPQLPIYVQSEIEGLTSRERERVKMEIGNKYNINWRGNENN
ncbi:hypothetical protein COX10_02360 [Candidatus Berkelbacteria bacterium CG23_combo_of_CG06-09_8_20_14_all_33_15]|nr:MAG: hypothetical protein COX10_02360 [Candidatus Berkelbacteria bacterium CG23_combo_of_CG06-09_8_20_14_all_33_15]